MSQTEVRSERHRFCPSCGTEAAGATTIKAKLIFLVGVVLTGGILAGCSSGSPNGDYQAGYKFGTSGGTVVNLDLVSQIGLHGAAGAACNGAPGSANKSQGWINGCVAGLIYAYGPVGNGSTGSSGNPGNTTTTTAAPPTTTTSTTATISTSGLPSQQAQFVNALWSAFPGMQSRMANFYGAYPYTVQMLVTLAERACSQGESALASAGDIPTVTSGVGYAQADQNLQLMMSIVTKDLCQ
jgi:hypothetical protein